MGTPAHAELPCSEPLSREERIRHRAYELYLKRDNQPGTALDDWLEAEEEIRRVDEDILQAQEDSIDEASEESFPASDPPAY